MDSAGEHFHSPVGLAPDAIRAELEKILASPGFAGSELRSRFLRYSVEEVLRGRGSLLKEYVWGVEVFCRGESFDPRLDPVVRVQASRVRSKLKEYFETDGRDDGVIIDFPDRGYAPAFRRRESVAIPAQAKGAVSGRFPYVLAIGISLVLINGAAWYWGRVPASRRMPGLIRLTADSGLTTDPTWSGNGSLLVYASDHGSDGCLNLWMQQLPNRTPLRLTRDTFDNHEPSLSPDGSQVAFRSERDGGGIYLIPVLGGGAKCLVKRGRTPRFSPDGKNIAYWVGPPISGDPLSPGSSKIFVVPVSGGDPQLLAPEFAAAQTPIWMPDGRHLLFAGSLTARESLEEAYDWWVIPAGGGAAARTGAAALFRKYQLLAPAGFGVIIAKTVTAPNRVIFPARSGDSNDLWQLELSPTTFQVRGSLERLTSETEPADQPSASADGRLVFASLRQRPNAWIVPLDANSGVVNGARSRLFNDGAWEIHVTLSPDGRKLAYSTDRAGTWDVLIRDLESGAESDLGATLWHETSPVFSPDGSKVAYRRGVFIDIVPAAGGRPAQVGERCGRPWSWSPDRRFILCASLTQPRSVLMLDVVSGSKQEILRHASYNLYHARFSSDGQWIAFSATIDPTGSRVFVAPYRGEGNPIPENAWIPVTESGSWNSHVQWSPDSSLIYYVSTRDGFRCLWARRLDRESKHPTGQPFPVLHFRSARESMMIDSVEIAVAPGILVYDLAELAGNIWMTKPAE